ncbi:MAG: hypothetical protein RIF33_16330 [Cyclobacteriaceae bacterium]
MKTMRNTLVVLLTVIGTSVFATGGDTMVDSLDFQTSVLPSLESKSFRLIYQSETQQPVHIKLRDENGTLQYSERYQLQSFVQPFDLSQLPDGNYTFELQTKEGKQVHEISNVRKEIVAPELSFDLEADSKVARLQTEAPMGANMRLLIYDQEGAMLHKEDWVAGQKINRQYNMEQVKGKGVTFLLLNNGSVVTEKAVKF